MKYDTCLKFTGKINIGGKPISYYKTYRGEEMGICFCIRDVKRFLHFSLTSDRDLSKNVVEGKFINLPVRNEKGNMAVAKIVTLSALLSIILTTDNPIRNEFVRLILTDKNLMMSVVPTLITRGEKNEQVC